MDELSLVTGGAGFIGSHLVEELVRRGRRVRVLDDFSTGLRANLAPLESVDVIEGSLTDPDAVARAVRGTGVIYHLGALASVARSVENPVATHAACATGTLHVLDAARAAGVRRVVYAASSSAYGGHAAPGGQSEDLPVAARSPYAAAKLAGELYALAFARTYGIETVRLRLFNVFGPRQRADSLYAGVVALFASEMGAGRSPTVFGDGRQARDFTFVADAVQALIRAAAAPGVSGNVYNVGTGRSATVLELVAALNSVLGTDIVPSFAPDRAGDVRVSRADVRRARTDLGYEPTVDFEEGLRRTVRWHTGSEARPGPNRRTTRPTAGTTGTESGESTNGPPDSTRATNAGGQEDAGPALTPGRPASGAVLILGGEGYVGSALAAYLLNSGFAVHSVDRGLRGTPGPAPNRTRRYQDLTADELGEYGTVILLAGHSSVAACRDDPVGSFANNVTGFVDLVHKLRDQRFLYASSASVHGCTRAGPAGDEDFLSAPVAIYDLHKQAVEQYARFARPDSYGLRFGSVAGPSPNVRTELLLNSLVRSALRRGRVEVANARAHRPVLGIGDLCRAVDTILTRSVPPGCYNLASANVRIGGLATWVARRFGVPLVEVESSTPYDLRVSPERFRRAAGFEFRDTIEGLTDALAKHYAAVEE